MSLYPRRTLPFHSRIYRGSPMVFIHQKIHQRARVELNSGVPFELGLQNYLTGASHLSHAGGRFTLRSGSRLQINSFSILGVCPTSPYVGTVGQVRAW